MTNSLVHELVGDELRDRMIALRRDLHQFPELSSQEVRTADRLEAELMGLDPVSLCRIASTGVIARIAGHRSSAPMVAIRGDIDALPIQEETGVEFASVNSGVMHACGHDLHAAWTVGAAHLLTDNPAHGDVLVLLQPAEETAAGATAVLDSGGLEGVAAIVGGHIDMRYPLGTVVADPGPMAASADEFSIRLRGAGAHAARPHEGINPINGAAAVVPALQTIVPQTVAPGTPAVITVATINGGTASNVIPEVATVTGSVRAVSAADRRALHEGIARVSEAVAEAFSLSVAIEFLAGTPPLVNTADCVEWARSAAVGVLGADALLPLVEPNLGGEDFAFYLEKIPGCFFRVGGQAAGQDPLPAHSSRFLPADDAVPIGAALLAETARVASSSLS